MRWSPFSAVVAATLLAAGLGSPRAVFAQRAEENVTTSSEDAFGRSIGNESIGIYNEDEKAMYEKSAGISSPSWNSSM